MICDLNGTFGLRHYLYSVALLYFYVPHQHSSLLTREQSFHSGSKGDPSITSLGLLQAQSPAQRFYRGSPSRADHGRERKAYLR